MLSLLVPERFFLLILPHLFEVVHLVTGLFSDYTDLHRDPCDYRVFDYLRVKGVLLHFFIGSLRRNLWAKHAVAVHPSPEAHGSFLNIRGYLLKNSGDFRDGRDSV